MALTIKQIWKRYSHLEYIRRIYIKRLNESGVYESSFSEISQGLNKDGSVQTLSRSLPNSSWQFGKVIVNNVRLSILSPFQEFASERDPNSIFKGFLRHRSIIKIEDAFIDKYTDPDNPTEIAEVTFTGLLDSNTATTEQGFETITALDFISVLKEINVNELTLAQTTMNDLIYEIMNRSEFTEFFTVSSSTTYINSGYNATSIDVSQYDGTVMEMLEDLAKGHSIFYINPDDNTFYFKEVEPTPTVQHSFLEENNRKLKISGFREGIDRQITHWYWADTSISSIRSPEPVNHKIGTFDIDGITNAEQRQNTLDFVLTKTQEARPYFKLELPYFPIIRLLDKVEVQAFGSAPPDAARWGMFEFTDSDTLSPAIAPRWRKPAGIRISQDDTWLVRSIVHDRNLKTTLELEKINV